MNPVLNQSSVKNGGLGAHASTSSKSSTNLLSIDDFIDHPRLDEKIYNSTRKTCEEVVEEFFIKAKRFSYPLIGILGMVLAFIFNQSNDALKDLTKAVAELNSTMKVYQQNLSSAQRDIDRNKGDIEKLSDRVYRR